VEAHSNEEHDLMWSVGNSLGLVGFALDLFMAFTWVIGGKKHLDSRPCQLKFCVFAGIVFGLMGTFVTFPSLVLKCDLPCERTTSEW
jgi:hypothetical protein